MIILDAIRNAGLCPDRCNSLLDLIDGVLENPQLSEVLSLFYSGYTVQDERLFELAKEVRRIKEYSIDHLDELVRVACDNIEENKGHCYLAKDAEEARRIAGEIVGSGKTVVKAIDHVVEEVLEGDSLQRNHIYDSSFPEVLAKMVELGLVGEALLSSLDVSGTVASEIASALRRRFKEEVFPKADVGISGAGAIAADPGALFLVACRGSDRLVTMTPEVHLVIAGINSVVPTYSDAFKVSEYALRSTGYGALCVIGGPSKTGDIEKRITYGAHGPKELHVILLDNGRTKMREDPVLRQLLYCPRCGSLYTPPLWAAWISILREDKSPAEKCIERKCWKTCPLGIDIEGVLRRAALR